MFPIRTILHPTDFTERSDPAFHLALSLARYYGARLLVLHIGPPSVIAPVATGIPHMPEHSQEELAEKLRLLQAQAPQVSLETRLATATNPAAEILRVAEQIQCDLIVMGTHGLTGLERLLMGSVAEQVVRRASCPVLTVKIPQPQAQPVEDARPEVAAQALGASRA